MELLNDIRDLPSGLSSLELYHDAACSWVRRQSEIWSRWIPVDTNCFLGYGLVDEHGMFLSSMAGGVSCEVCPAGTYSENFADSGNSGRTRRCTPCPLGTSQAKAASSHCEACRPGTAAFAEGSVTCTPCPERVLPRCSWWDNLCEMQQWHHNFASRGDCERRLCLQDCFDSSQGSVRAMCRRSVLPQRKHGRFAFASGHTG